MLLQCHVILYMYSQVIWNWLMARVIAVEYKMLYHLHVFRFLTILKI